MGCATRYSKKRKAILDAIRSTDCHPSAEWVYHRLKEVHPDLSLGTVYRNLVFFRERGDIQSVGVIRGQERFDGITAPHSHFVCDSCGAIIDLPAITPDGAMLRTVCEQYELSARRLELTFYGQCPACARNTNLKEETLS